MMNRIYNPTALRELLQNRSYKELREMLAEQNPVDLAEFLSELDRESAVLVFRMLPKEAAADVFAELPAEVQQWIVHAATDAELSEIVNDLFVDDAVDMLEDMPANVVKRILLNTTPENRSLINQFLKYPENSAGSIMTAEFTDLRPAMTVSQAIRHIRTAGEDRETIYTCYVIDAQRRLQGVVSVRTLLLSPDEKLVQDLMEDQVISVTTATDQEETVRLLTHYDLLSLPVVDRENRLVGIVTVDDAMDVMEQEATEDFEKMAAMSPSEKPYLKTGVMEMARHRIPWLLVLMISGMLTGGILGHYEAAFASMPLLVTFIPMLTDTGGNAGSQSSALVIRGLALHELRVRDIPRVFWKELRVSMVVGVVLSAVNFFRLLLTYPGQTATALTVAFTMLFTVLMAKTIGGILPLAAKACHMDPAIMASPLITTIVDAVSLVIYFTIASVLLPL